MKHPISTRARRLHRMIRNLDKQRRDEAAAGRLRHAIRRKLAEMKELGKTLVIPEAK